MLKQMKGERIHCQQTWITRNSKKSSALTGVAQWVGHCPADLKVASSIPGQGICLGYGKVPS